MARYDDHYFDYISTGSRASAEVVVPFVRSILNVDSLLDVGCGQGAWLEVWRENGVEDVTGLDGEYVDVNSLRIPTSTFRPTNLNESFALDREYSLVSCLEVAEHLLPASSDALVESLCRHADFVLFSAAPPGQGGADHVNEQPYEFWKVKFESLGFVMLDCLRPQITGNRKVKPWYRYNSFLLVRDNRVAELPDTLRATLLTPGTKPRDVSPIWYKLRKALVHLLRLQVVNRLAAINERITRL
jgi:hypothetical protein